MLSLFTTFLFSYSRTCGDVRGVHSESGCCGQQDDLDVTRFVHSSDFSYEDADSSCDMPVITKWKHIPANKTLSYSNGTGTANFHRVLNEAVLQRGSGVALCGAYLYSEGGTIQSVDMMQVGYSSQSMLANAKAVNWLFVNVIGISSNPDYYYEIDVFGMCKQLRPALLAEWPYYTVRFHDTILTTGAIHSKGVTASSSLGYNWALAGADSQTTNFVDTHDPLGKKTKFFFLNATNVSNRPLPNRDALYNSICDPVSLFPFEDVGLEARRDVVCRMGGKKSLFSNEITQPLLSS